MKSLILKYGLILFIALSAFKFLEYQFFSYKITLEIYLGVVATTFLLVGFFFSKHYFSQESKSDQSKQASIIDQQKLSEFSQREQDVLQLLCHGYENKEIAISLNISINTVKTHLSRLFVKLGVNNRTQALSEAKLLNIV